MSPKNSIGKENAIELYHSNWWEGLSYQEIAGVQLFTTELCCPFDVFHEAVEKSLGRPVFTHEFGLNYSGICEEFLGEREQPILKIRKPPKAYPINFEKLKGESMGTLPYLLGVVGFSEDYEYFDKIKHLLIIPEKPKTLEELSQELDEKFDDLLVRTKRKFAVSKESAEYHYNRKFETINGNFEYAKEYGYFPQITFLDSSKFTISSKFDISSPSFVIKQSNSHQGYYTIGEDGYYKFYMEKKPNIVFRWFIKRLMGFKWIDEVLK